MSRRPVIRRRTGPPPTSSASTREGYPAGDPLLDLPLGEEDDGASELGFGGSGEGSPPPAPSFPESPASPGPSPRPGAAGRSGGRPTRWPWLLLLLLPLAAGAGYLLRPLPPVAALSTDLVDFGDVRLGEEASGTVRLANDGEAPLEVLGLEVGVEAGADDALGLGAGSCGEVPLGAGESCELAVIFSPREAGAVRGRLRLRTNAGAAERTVPLLGRGVAPELAVEPARLDLGEATVGERGGRGVVRLTNRGSAPVRVDGARLEGLGAADFVRFDDRCAGGELAAGDGCTVSFEFVPTAAGERRAAVRFQAAAPVPAAPELTGRGLPQLPVLALEPDRLDFGSRRVGEAGEVAEVELRNDGNGPLELRRVRVTAPGAAPEAASSFTVEDLGCAGRRLEPGDSCRLLLGFEPTREGQLGAVVEVEHGAAPGLHRLPVVGVGTAPRASLSPGQLAFGEVALGRESPWRRLEIRNTGSAVLRIERVSLRGADARSFEASADGCLRAPIPPAQSCSVEVRFGARRDGPHRAELHVRHDAGDGFETVAVNGVGISARLGVDPASLDFGEIRVGTTRLVDAVLRNTGRAPLTVRRVRVSGAGLEVERDCAGAVLVAGGECVVKVRATPGSAGSVRGRLDIEHDGDGSPRRVTVTLAALPRPRPDLVLESRRMTFTERYVGERSPIESLVLRNGGDARLELREMEIEGPAAGDFQLVPGSCATLVAPSTSCTVGLAFAPTGAGTRRATLTVRHDAEGGVARIALEGRGVARP